MRSSYFKRNKAPKPETLVYRVEPKPKADPSAQPVVPPLPAVRPVPVAPPPIGREWHGQPWPLNETEIDLPTHPVAASGPAEREATPIYIGTLRVQHPAAPDPLDVDLQVEAPDHIRIGGYWLDRVQALKCCRLLLIAVNAVDAVHPVGRASA